MGTRSLEREADGPRTPFSLAGPQAAVALAALRQELETMHQAGEPARRIIDRTKLKLRCGKCHRRLGTVEPHFNHGRLHVEGDAVETAVDPARPMIERYSVPCHKRCCDRWTRHRTLHEFRIDQLVDGYVAAVRAGVGSLYLS